MNKKEFNKIEKEIRSTYNLTPVPDYAGDGSTIISRKYGACYISFSYSRVCPTIFFHFPNTNNPYTFKKTTYKYNFHGAECVKLMPGFLKLIEAI
jgi:hypothetical protein